MDMLAAERVAKALGITPEQFEVRKDFLLISPEDIRNLVSIRDKLQEIPDYMFDSFYSHLMGFEQTRTVFKDQAQVDELKRKQKQHFMEMLSGEYGYDYLLKRLAVGAVHSRLNIIPLWYIGAFSRYIFSLLDLLNELYDKNSDEILPRFKSLLKMILLDIIITLESYHYAQYKVQEELSVAKNAAEVASKTKSEFLANMSHEVRTPLNGILGLSDLVLSEDIPPRVREYLKLIKQSGVNLLGIINDILDLSKIESGRAELDRIEFDPRDSVAATMAPLAVSAMGKGLRTVFSVAEDVPKRLVGDPGRLRQILTNLVGNAVKFSPQGQVTVTVRVHGACEPGKVRLLFRVADMGIGIPADKLDHIFESFAQAASSAHLQYGGTGLGLTISKNLVEMMGGEIWVESEVGKGSTFYFTASFGLAGEGVQPEAEVRAAAPAPSGALRILLAEDDMVNRLLAGELLKQRGHQVEEAENGREALDKLKAEPFDLVLMDVRMPVLDGTSAVAAIRRGEAGLDKAGVKVVALTAHALKGDRERFLAAGMDDYLTKPIDMEELELVLKRFAKPALKAGIV